MPGTPPGEGGPAPTPETNPGTSAGPTGLSQEPGIEIAGVIGPSVSDTD
jgi:hypothetical protein